MPYVAIVNLELNGTNYVNGDAIASEDLPSSKIRSMVDKGLIDFVSTSQITEDESGNVTIAGTMTAGTVNQASATGNYALAIGSDAQETVSGEHSIAIGLKAQATASGGYSVAIGDYAQYAGSGAATVAIGMSAQNQSSSDYSIAIGRGAQQTSGSSGAYSIALGAYTRSSGAHSTAIGTGLNGSKTTANYDGAVAIGADSTGLGAVAGAQDEIKLGTALHTVNIPGTVNGGTLSTNVGTGTKNTVYGFEAGANISTGSGMTYIGYRAGKASGGALYSTAVGASAIEACYGNNNTAIGYNAGYTLTNGERNTLVGAWTSVYASSDYQTAIGYSAQVSDVGGVAIGVDSDGAGAIAGSPNAIAISGEGYGTRAIAIGYKSSTLSSYAIAIGSDTSATHAGSVALGVDSGGGAAATSTTNQIVLGTANHTVKVLGTLEGFTSTSELKAVAAASTDFADFQSRIAAL